MPQTLPGNYVLQDNPVYLYVHALNLSKQELLIANSADFSNDSLTKCKQIKAQG